MLLFPDSFGFAYFFSADVYSCLGSALYEGLSKHWGAFLCLWDQGLEGWSLFEQCSEAWDALQGTLSCGIYGFSEPKPQNKPGKPFPVWGQWDQAGHLLSKHRQSQARGLRLEGCDGAGATRWRCDYRDPQSCVYFGWVICLSAGYFNLILLVFVIPDYLCFPELLACMSLRKLAGAGLRGIGWADIEGKGWGNGQGPWCNGAMLAW